MEEPWQHFSISWRRRDTGQLNRVVLPRRGMFALLGAGLGALLLAVVFGAVAVHLQQHVAGLETEAAQLGAERAELARHLERAEAELQQIQEDLGRVRAEEAKIRTWLGFERDILEDADSAPEDGGGKGSLGEVDLETVNPGDRLLQADAGTPLQELEGVARSLAADLAELAGLVGERKAYWDAVPAITPVDGEHWLSSAFGWRQSPFTGKREFHSGVDLAGAAGTPVLAAAAGRVERVVQDVALGRAVTIDHGHGIRTIYGHLERSRVRPGQRVARGEAVGSMGSSGRRSTGPHLHYAIKVDEKFVNPANYMLDRARGSFTTAAR